MVPLPIIFFVFLLLRILARPVITLAHELGHGIPALLLTSSDVEVYVGSYGDADGSLRIAFGRLKLFLKCKFGVWGTGMCRFQTQSVSLDRNIVITLAGPLSALLFCLALSVAGLLSDLPGGYKASVWLFLAMSLYEFCYNLYPRSRPTYLHDGGITYNDGRQIITLLDYKRMPRAAQDALPFLATGEYEAAGEQLRGVIDSGAGNRTVYRLAISAFSAAGRFEDAQPLSDALMTTCRANSDDYCWAGVIKARLDKKEEALPCLAASLRLDPENGYALLNRGYVFLLLDRYEEAVSDFDRVIATGLEKAYVLSNRGLAKIKSGNAQAGLEDIHAALAIDGNHAYAYKNLGIHHFDRREYAQALTHFEKAYALDPGTHQVETYLAQTRQVMEEAGQNTSSSA